jgi:hypothetical protein
MVFTPRTRKQSNVGEDTSIHITKRDWYFSPTFLAQKERCPYDIISLWPQYISPVIIRTQPTDFHETSYVQHGVNDYPILLHLTSYNNGREKTGISVRISGPKILC